MGVRITLYAVDLPQFELSLDQSLANVLLDYVKHGTESGLGFSFVEPIHTRYVASPKIGIRKLWWENPELGERQVCDLTPSEALADPLISTKARDYLNKNSSFELGAFLGALALFPHVDWVQKISSGYRRWWIGSFLDYAEKYADISPQDDVRLATVFQKVLRVYECGKRLMEIKYELTDFDFPVIPTDDVDLWMGVWTELDIAFVLRQVHAILQRKPQFTAPSDSMRIPAGPTNNKTLVELMLQEHNHDYGAAGMASGLTDTEWNEWVHEMLAHLLKVQELGYEHPNIVSFIDS